MSDPRFELLGHEDLVIADAGALRGAELLSPYVWRDGDGLSLLLRAVAPDEAVSGRIWHGRSRDGLRFTMADAPALVPSLAHLDGGGCEDPTAVDADEGLVVFYTGVDDGGAAEMLWAAGADPASLEKRGIAYHCSKTEKNTKEASVLRRQDGAWCMFFEYSRDDRSHIGFTIGQGPDGPWEDHDDPITARPGRWDGHHLSTGPLIEMGDAVLMFYNGATADARWAIGWAVIDLDAQRVVDRCEEPLIVPSPDEGDGRDIAFANSLLIEDGLIRLYYSHDDRVPRRATLRRR